MSDIRVVVTGASSGIGRATAELLIEEGIEVVAAARSIEKLRDLRSKCAIHPCDVGDPHACNYLIEFARTGAKRYPVLVNAAGTAWFGPFAESEAPAPPEGQTSEELDLRIRQSVQEIENYVSQIRTNLVGPMHLCKAAIPWMLERGGGRIVNVLSIAATHPFSGAAAYCASKAGLHMFSKVIAEEFGERGIRVSAILPGSTDTPLWDEQSFVPNRADMLTPGEVAERIRDMILSPSTEPYEEVVLLPPKGIL